MPTFITEDEALKLNIINLVKDHRSKCGPDCNVSLYRIRQLAERAGLTFTEEEKQLFL